MDNQAVDSIESSVLPDSQDTDTAQAMTIDTIVSDEVETDSSDIDYISKYTFEDYYLDAFIATDNKSKSFEKACVATDHPIPKYPTQSAYSYHKGLEAKGIVEKALQRATLSDRIASRMKLNELRDGAKSEQVQLAAAKHTSGDMYATESTAQGIEVHVNRDNVQIKAGKDTLTIENDSK